MTASTADLAVAGRDFRLFWLGETTSLLGSSVAAVALPLIAVVTLQADTFTVGLLTAAAWLPWLVIGLTAGAWVDRLPRRPVMVICDGVSLVVFASIPVAAWFGVLTIAQLLAAATLGGCARVFFTAAYRAYLPELLSPSELMAGNARLQGSASTVQVVGPGLAGLLTQAFGAVSGLVVDALSFGVSALCLRAIRTRERRSPPSATRRLRGQIGDGLKFVVHDPYLRVLVCFSAVSNIALTGFGSIEVVFLVREVGVEAGTVGPVFALCGFGGVVGALTAGRIASRFGTARGALLCQVCAAPLALLIPLTGPGVGLAFFVVGNVGIGIGVVASCVITDTFRQRYCPPELIGRIGASAAVVSYGAIPVGGLLGGGLGAAFGVRETMWMMTGLQALSVTVLLASRIRRLRDFPGPADRIGTRESVS